MSACNASRLRAVSLRVSPFVRLEFVAEILITSALNRNAANSNEVRVRVLGSTKKFTSVLPRSAGTFLISRVPTSLNASAVSRTKLSSSADNSRSPRRSLRVQRVVIGFSGECTRLACWRARPRDRELFLEVQNARRGNAEAKPVSARRRNQHAGRVCSPEIARSQSFHFQPYCVRLIIGFLHAHLNLFSRCGR